MADKRDEDPSAKALVRKSTAQDTVGDVPAAHNSIDAGPVGQAIQAGTLQGGVHVYAPVESLAAAMHTLPRDVASFTGRAAEVTRLTRAVLGQVGKGCPTEIIAIDGMAGVGKTALAIHIAHKLAPEFPEGQIFLRLYGHTPGQTPVDPADALATLLLTSGVAPQQIPPGVDARAALWRDRMAGKRTLLLLDDASSSSQVKPLLPGGTGTIVLLTSRRRLVALPDTMPVTLEILDSNEAKDLLARLTGMADTEHGLTNVVTLCGFLPLAITLIAGRLKHHGSWTLTDLADELSSSKDRLESMQAEDDSVVAALDLSYRDLNPEQQLLFRRLGAHPGADFDAYVAVALVDTDHRTAGRLLDGLFTAHVVDEPVRSRYRFHDLIRAYARSITGADDLEDHDAAVTRLFSYYVSTVQVADMFFGRHALNKAHDRSSMLSNARRINSRAEASAWMSAERANLHAIADYAGQIGRSSAVTSIATSMHAYLRSQGYWDQAVNIYGIALEQARLLGDHSVEARILQDLGDVQRLMGEFVAAAASQEGALALYRELGDRHGQADTLNHLGFVMRRLSNYPVASARLESALILYRDLGDWIGEADALNYLGDVQRIIGDHAIAAANQSRALALYREMEDQHGQANVLCSQGEAWRLRGNYESATECLTRALQLARELGSRNAQANCLNYLGDVQRCLKDYAVAEVTQRAALELYYQLGNRHGQANALNYLGNVQRLSGEYDEAAASQEKALALYRELGNRYGEVQALIGSGDVLLAIGEASQAVRNYELALMIAQGIGVRLEEAQAIEGLGRCYTDSNMRVEALEALGRALSIYRELSPPGALAVENYVADLGRC